MTPEAWASRWVREELDLALATNRQILPVLHKSTLVEGFIRTRQWVDVVGLPGAAAAAKVSAALGGSPQTASATATATTTRPASPIVPAAPTVPPDRFPPRLAQLGYTGRVLGGVEVILPPLCDVPAGVFLMGSDSKQDADAQANEQPPHKVLLPDFQIARFPVTVAEYACFVRDGRAEPTSKRVTWRTQLEQRRDHPVVNVSWHDAVAYAAWLAERTGQPWRLPSEAEWEKAARWDPETRTAWIYPWGDPFDKRRANTSESGKKTTTPVGSYPSGASPCGAQDMAGNVWEWTNSLFVESYPYSPDEVREKPDSPGRKTLRGGSWINSSGLARAAYRFDLGYSFSRRVGFRVVLAAPGS